VEHKAKKALAAVSEYYKLRDEVKDAEQIRRSVYSIMRAEQRETQPRKTRDIDR